MRKSFDFSNRDLQGIDFSDHDLTGADFTDADLTGANMKHADVKAAIFNRTKLSGVNWHGAYNVFLYGPAPMCDALIKVIWYPGGPMFCMPNFWGDKAEFENWYSQFDNDTQTFHDSMMRAIYCIKFSN